MTQELVDETKEKITQTTVRLPPVKEVVKYVIR